VRRSALGAIAAQGAQALASFVLQIAVARTLGIGGLGAFAILYGVVVLASGTITGFVGDSLVVLPLAGPLLFGVRPDLRAVLGWLAYTVSVAAVTPYGALAAVGGRQALVFAIRAGDTAVSLAAVVVALAVGLDPAWSAALLAVGSLAGGLVIRFALVPRLAPRILPAPVPQAA
jgi:hypothetical protein